ncbi:hypothetical protein CERSUDRAFT_127747 [Gelatoporia subvermispora B]|uniref:Uncharacterized protein n=1 Tax=Ceriporiopsis subvermispora (strain B) TaxID=914234 RepID=M2QXR6_CERS8|nr:hypothetical protein CERSUDRAFT_127747 [Gelatoporia subvermispora B]
MCIELGLVSELCLFPLTVGTLGLRSNHLTLMGHSDIQDRDLDEREHAGNTLQERFSEIFGGSGMTWRELWASATSSRTDRGCSACALHGVAARLGSPETCPAHTASWAVAGTETRRSEPTRHGTRLRVAWAVAPVFYIATNAKIKENKELCSQIKSRAIALGDELQEDFEDYRSARDPGLDAQLAEMLSRARTLETVRTDLAELTLQRTLSRWAHYGSTRNRLGGHLKTVDQIAHKYVRAMLRTLRNKAWQQAIYTEDQCPQLRYFRHCDLELQYRSSLFTNPNIYSEQWSAKYNGRAVAVRYLRPGEDIKTMPLDNVLLRHNQHLIQYLGLSHPDITQPFVVLETGATHPSGLTLKIPVYRLGEEEATLWSRRKISVTQVSLACDIIFAQHSMGKDTNERIRNFSEAIRKSEVDHGDQDYHTGLQDMIQIVEHTPQPTMVDFNAGGLSQPRLPQIWSSRWVIAVCIKVGTRDFPRFYLLVEPQVLSTKTERNEVVLVPRCKKRAERASCDTNHNRQQAHSDDDIADAAIALIGLAGLSHETTAHSGPRVLPVSIPSSPESTKASISSSESSSDEETVFELPFEVPVGQFVDTISVRSNMSWTRLQLDLADKMDLPYNGLTLGYKFSSDRQSQRPRLLDTASHFLALISNARQQLEGNGKRKRLVISIINLTESPAETKSKGGKNISSNSKPKNPKKRISEPQCDENHEVQTSKTGPQFVPELQARYKCAEHAAWCWIRPDNTHRRLKIPDLSLWAQYISMDRATIEEPPSEIRVNDDAGPAPPRGRAGPRGHEMPINPYFPNGLPSGYPPMFMPFPMFNTNPQYIPPAMPPSSPVTGHDNPTQFPRIDDWLHELDTSERGADGQNYAYWAPSFTQNGFVRIHELANKELFPKPKDLQEICPGMPLGIASSLLSYARYDTTRIRNH